MAAEWRRVDERYKTTMTFNANSSGIVVTDTNGTTVFNTSTQMPTIIAQFEGSFAWPLTEVRLDKSYVIANGGPFFVTAVYVRAIALDTVSIDISYSDSLGNRLAEKPVFDSRTYPQVFIRIRNLNPGLEGVVPGMTDKWMHVTGGTLVRSIAGAVESFRAGSGYITNLGGTETLDVFFLEGNQVVFTRTNTLFTNFSRVRAQSFFGVSLPERDRDFPNAGITTTMPGSNYTIDFKVLLMRF